MFNQFRQLKINKGNIANQDKKVLVSCLSDSKFMNCMIKSRKIIDNNGTVDNLERECGVV